MLRELLQKLLKGLKGEGPVTSNIQIVGIVLFVVVMVLAVGAVIGGGLRGTATFMGHSYNTVSGQLSSDYGGFTNPFTQNGVLLQAFRAVFGQ